MEFIATEHAAEKGDTAFDRPSEVGFVQCSRVNSLNVATVASNPLLPTDRIWAIRFNAGGTVTIVLGMRDYWRGWLSPYFAGLVATRLGIPFRRIRLYYSATLPAVLQTPVSSAIAQRRNDIGPVASAVADVIERMCDQVIERGRSTFAALVGVAAFDASFDPRTGRFFVVDRERSSNILDIAETSRAKPLLPTELAKELRIDNHLIARTFLRRYRTLIKRLQIPRKTRRSVCV
jgi:hypothetical protein